MRWWSQITEDGSEEWIFESMGDDWVQNGVDGKVFWMGSYASFGAWLALACIATLSLNVSGISICAVGAVMAFVNLMGYQRCEKDKKQQLKDSKN